VYSLALEDLAEAASLFRPEWERTAGVDGYVSLEVPPDVAYDAAATVALARRLHEEAGFPNLLVKIPGTPQGLTAMEDDHRRDRGERDPAVLRQPLPAHRRRLHPCLERRREPGWTWRCRHWPRCLSPAGTQPPTPAAAGASWPAGAGDDTEGLLLPFAAAVRQALAGARRSRHASATAAVGIHLGQEPRSSRHLLSGPPSCPQHHRHRPGKDATRLRRPWDPG
jgi:hypothetical protein